MFLKKNLKIVPADLEEVITARENEPYMGIPRRICSVLNMINAEYASKDIIRRSAILGTWFRIADTEMSLHTPEYCWNVYVGAEGLDTLFERITECLRNEGLADMCANSLKTVYDLGSVEMLSFCVISKHLLLTRFGSSRGLAPTERLRSKG